MMWEAPWIDGNGHAAPPSRGRPAAPEMCLLLGSQSPSNTFLVSFHTFCAQRRSEQSRDHHDPSAGIRRLGGNNMKQPFASLPSQYFGAQDPCQIYRRSAGWKLELEPIGSSKRSGSEVTDGGNTPSSSGWLGDQKHAARLVGSRVGRPPRTGHCGKSQIQRLLGPLQFGAVLGATHG